MSTLDEHARDIRRAVAALRDHTDEHQGELDYHESSRLSRAVLTLEDGIMRTLPMLGIDAPEEVTP